MNNSPLILGGQDTLLPNAKQALFAKNAVFRPFQTELVITKKDAIRRRLQMCMTSIGRLSNLIQTFPTNGHNWKYQVLISQFSDLREKLEVLVTNGRKTAVSN
jgi:hypothetical protein